VKNVGGAVTYYLVDDRNPSGYAQVLEEITAYAGTTNLTKVYAYGLDLISQEQPGVATNYYGHDGHGSVRYLTSISGGITDTYTYDAYGNLVASSGSTANNYLYCGEQYDPQLKFYYNRARYLNPDTGRFWTMDTFPGNNEDPLSLHKYLYCQDEPVNLTDPFGKSVYVVTRPLDMTGFRRIPSLAVHVYLAFDTEGISDQTSWDKAVSESASTQNHPNTYGISYVYNDSPVTMSFHPKSVLNNDYTGAYYGVAITPSSYIAFNASIDIHAFKKSGTGYKRYMVASGDNIQMQLFHFAIASRDANNNGRPDPDKYSFLINNCGSWVDHVLKSNGIEFPDRNINEGFGIGGRASALGYAAYAGSQAARSGWLGIGPLLINDLFF
jgi:RHS repeat-associated protein